MKKVYWIMGIVIIILLAIIFLINGNIEKTPTIKQGVYGTVKLRTGDCMPTVGGPSSCKVSYVSRTIYIRKPASSDDMDEYLYIYLKNKPELIKQVKSDSNGFYEADLPVGRYSIFVEDEYNGEKKEYCSSFSGSQFLEACQIDVGNQLIEYDILINHAVD